MFGRLRYASRPIRPSGPSGRPLPFSRVHVSPPSVDLQTPSPQLVLWRLFDSPVPTHSRSGLLCETATSPIDIRLTSWNCASKVVPALVVFQTPPCAVPT